MIAGGSLSTFRDYLDEWVNPAQPVLTFEQQQNLNNYDDLKKKLNQNFPDLLDKDGKIDDKKLVEIKGKVEKVKLWGEIIQATGLNLEDKNVLEEAKNLKKVSDDLKDLGIDKNKVKKSIDKYVETLESLTSREYVAEIQVEIKKL